MSVYCRAGYVFLSPNSVFNFRNNVATVVFACICVKSKIIILKRVSHYARKREKKNYRTATISSNFHNFSRINICL